MSNIWVRCIHYKKSSCLSTHCGNGIFKQLEEEHNCEEFVVNWTSFITKRDNFIVMGYNK